MMGIGNGISSEIPGIDEGFKELWDPAAALESDSLVHCGTFMSLWESEMRNAMLCKAGT